MNPPSSSKWICCKPPRPEAKLRLFCLPWAGGNSTAFNRWRDLPAEVEVCAVELPGRMSRRAEPLLESVHETVAQLAAALNAGGFLRDSSRPFALFGHSLGALVAFELARVLVTKYGAQPLRLIVSGARPPDQEQTGGGGGGGGGMPVSELPRDDLVAYLVAKGGIPAQLAEEREVLDFYLPPIRADYM
ncbi:unnamed protein product [Phaeothamnion confervicola]